MEGSTYYKDGEVIMTVTHTSDNGMQDRLEIVYDSQSMKKQYKVLKDWMRLHVRKVK